MEGFAGVLVCALYSFPSLFDFTHNPNKVPQRMSQTRECEWEGTRRAHNCRFSLPAKEIELRSCRRCGGELQVSPAPFEEQPLSLWRCWELRTGQWTEGTSGPRSLRGAVGTEPFGPDSLRQPPRCVCAGGQMMWSAAGARKDLLGK